MPDAPIDLRTDTLAEPVGIGSATPGLAWRLPGGQRAQTAYAVEVTTAAGHTVWESGRVPEEPPFGATYGGPPLESGTSYRWRVRVWNPEESPWSDWATFETGILDPARWQASWIGGKAGVLYLRGMLDVPDDVIRGRAYVSALGWYRFLVNDEDLTGPALVPRWTPFDQYVEYQTYDVTGALRPGPNALTLVVGDGRFRGRNGFRNKRALYGDRLAGFAQVHLTRADGTTVVTGTSPEWRAGTGPIRASDPKYGEVADLRTPIALGPAATEQSGRELIAEEVGRVRPVATLEAVAISRTPSGRHLVDFGQNFAGVVRLKLAVPAGTTVTLTHSEVVGANGEIDTGYLFAGPLGRWKQRDTVTADGTGDWWQPWFTIHGFRYAAIDGYPGELDPAYVQGVVLSSDLPRSGDFGCSDDELTKLHENVGWSLRSNFTDTATDCPTRERSGWTGDIQVFAPTATTYVDVQAFLRRYLRNLAAEQYPDGRVPVFVPSEASTGTRLARMAAASAGWGDAAVLLPWTLYQYYGDTAVLESGYGPAVAWVEHLAGRARDGLVVSGFHFGEWLRPGENAGTSIADVYRRSRPVIASAYLFRSASVLSSIAALLGRQSDAARFKALADRTRSAWRAAFVSSDGRIGTDRQDDYVRALAFDLLDASERAGAADRLSTLITEAGDHLGTGFLSTPYLLPVLADHGRPDLAWRLLRQRTNPSWLYQVTRGATTVWETWEGYDAKGRARMSHNHYAFGSVAGFLTERVAGLAPAAPGYRVIDVRPLPGGPLSWANAAVLTPYGRAVVSWTREDSRTTLSLTVPSGTRARVHTPVEIRPYGPGTHTTTWTD